MPQKKRQSSKPPINPTPGSNEIPSPASHVPAVAPGRRKSPSKRTSGKPGAPSEPAESVDASHAAGETETRSPAQPSVPPEPTSDSNTELLPMAAAASKDGGAPGEGRSVLAIEDDGAPGESSSAAATEKSSPARGRGARSRGRKSAAPSPAAPEAVALVPGTPAGETELPVGTTVQGREETGVRAAIESEAAHELAVSADPPATAAPKAAGDSLSIVIVTPEAHPFASTGGLAEVAAALPLALAAAGHAITLVLPRYREVDVAGTTAVPLSFCLGSRDVTVSVLERRLPNGILAAFVDAPDLFDRSGLYGDDSGDYPDNAWRFAVFSRAALEYVRARKSRPSVIHAHDWQTGLVPVYQKMAFSSDPIVGGVPVVFTIHNLAFQGLFPASTVETIGLDWNVMDIQAMEYWGQVSYLKAGINFSERITTVSPTYASEITSPELGFGFDGILRRRAGDLVGILNGIDTTRWNPERDEFVPASFTADDLSGKARAKQALVEAAGLAPQAAAPDRPIIGLVSRLTDQKGFDLIAASADDLMALEASWVLLGSGEARYEDLWRTLAAEHPGRVSVTIGFDERLTHLIEAGADMFLMPSRFEPCGLNQLYSLRYGTLPIVRATGGLKDTVQDAAAGGTGTGFSFTQYTPVALVSTVRRALDAFTAPDVWRAIQQRAMQQDHSWDASAREYVKVYRALTEHAAADRADTPVGAAEAAI